MSCMPKMTAKLVTTAGMKLLAKAGESAYYLQEQHYHQSMLICNLALQILLVTAHLVEGALCCGLWGPQVLHGGEVGG